jgi:hypothetical protein
LEGKENIRKSEFCKIHYLPSLTYGADTLIWAKRNVSRAQEVELSFPLSIKQKEDKNRTF